MKAKRLFVLVLTLLLALNSIAIFLEPEAKANIVLNEDFSDISDWTFVFGSWTASNGIIQGENPSGGALGWTGDKDWSNYIVSAKLRIIAPGDEASLVVRYSDWDSYYQIGLGSSSYKYSITKIENGVGTLLASFGSAGEIEVNKWYVVTAQVICGTLVMFVDDQEVLVAEDDSLPAGAVGLVTWDGIMQTKDLVVQSLGWYKVYGNTNGGTHNEWANDIIQTNDGGFAIAGQRKNYLYTARDVDRFLLLKTDANGNEIWKYTYGAGQRSVANKIIGTTDGGFAMLGYNYPSIVEIEGIFTELGWTPMLIKTDSEGKQLWWQPYSPPNYSGGMYTPRILSSIVQTADGGYAMVGTIYSNLTSASSMYDFWLVKTDPTGVMLWNKMYGNINYDEQASTIIETYDGGLAFAGYTNSSGNKNFLLIKTDSSGNVFWERTYGGMSDEAATSLIQLPDGGFALCGGNLFVRTDANGNVISEKNYNGNISSMTETIDGNLLLEGTVSSGSWIAEISVTGVIEWTKTLPHFWSSTRFIQTADSGYATVDAMSVGESPLSNLGDITLIKFNSDFMEDQTGEIPTPTPSPTPSPSASPTPTASPTPSPTPPPTQEKYAVIVGISNYENVNGTQYSDNDAQSLYNQLEPSWGADHIKLLINEYATKEAISSAIKTWLSPLEGLEDTVLFYFSGHGGQAVDYIPVDEVDNIDELIAPTDYLEVYATNDITDDELNVWLNYLDSEKIAVVIDSCMSGGFINDLSKNGRVVLTACSETEQSSEYNSLEHGLFSFYLLNGFSDSVAVDINSDQNISIEELFKYAEPKVLTSQGTNITQHPQMYDGFEGEITLLEYSPPIMSPTITPTPSPSPTPSPQPTQSPTATPTPTPTPTVKPTAQPTANPTSNPTTSPTTNTPTQNPTAIPSPIPVGLELTLAIIISFFITLLLIALVIRQRKISAIPNLV